MRFWVVYEQLGRSLNIKNTSSHLSSTSYPTSEFCKTYHCGTNNALILLNS